MKKLITTILCFVGIASAFATQDQFRTELKGKKRDSTQAAIIRKQDSIIVISTNISTLSINKEKNKVAIDSLTKKKEIMSAQINELKKVNTTVQNDEEQSNTLSISILIFGAVLIALILAFGSRNKSSDNDSFHTYKLVGIMFIGTVSVFLIPAGFNTTQITPIVGLLGTLAGYLVGSSNQTNVATKPKVPSEN
ncbi:hypothetical protein SAMN05216464_104380 [Mucilaginibacter pineti]|uniref:Uncharacterized protein n=1 Tax=Mucilaginibacter pineti TaxID=1391627 RepID=A0A1G7B3K5_9SPHI|nr:hypothetical protein [Mucilaginibacter pineti]SDE21427.1 hypothetical protein SAMN05216464_104380 [Mucilaginibacter pineti]